MPKNSIIMTKNTNVLSKRSNVISGSGFAIKKKEPQKNAVHAGNMIGFGLKPVAVEQVTNRLRDVKLGLPIIEKKKESKLINIKF
jgi:hypothetical protein